MKRWPMPALAAALACWAVALSGCTAVPRGLTPVDGFELDRYLGKWYEIARLDHRFERGLTDVNAAYRRLSDGTIEVVNRGFDPRRGAWRQVTGRARLAAAPSVASLEVSFFGPFWGGYHVIALDHEHYRWAMVAGPSRDYLWILSRERRLAPKLFERLVTMAAGWGFDTGALIRVPHRHLEEDAAAGGPPG